jgi:hypothetical protein
MKCPKCGHEYPAKNQAKGGKNRWKGMTKKQRSEEMKRVRAKGISSSEPSVMTDSYPAIRLPNQPKT